VTREEAAQSLVYHIETLRDQIRGCYATYEVAEVWKHDLEALLLAQAALRRLDELEQWARAHLETIGLYGDPWGEELGCYNTLDALLGALNGEMTFPKERP